MVLAFFFEITHVCSKNENNTINIKIDQYKTIVYSRGNKEYNNLLLMKTEI